MSPSSWQRQKDHRSRASIEFIVDHWLLFCQTDTMPRARAYAKFEFKADIYIPARCIGFSALIQKDRERERESDSL